MDIVATLYRSVSKETALMQSCETRSCQVSPVKTISIILYDLEFPSLNVLEVPGKIVRLGTV